MDLDSMKDDDNTKSAAPAEENAENSADAGTPVGMDEKPQEEATSGEQPPDAPPESLDEALEEHPDVQVVRDVIEGLETAEADAEVRNSERIESIRLLRMAAIHIRQI